MVGFDSTQPLSGDLLRDRRSRRKDVPWVVEDSREYRRGRCYSNFWEVYRGVIPEEHHKAVSKESGELAHVERWNNSLHQRLSRFVRKSLSFSKSDEMHEACLKLLLHRHNKVSLCVELLPQLV
jgi:hypothetical protein